MTKYVIKGGKTLNGEVRISGSKNAALPIIVATLLTKERVVIRNVPDLRDIRTIILLLNTLGSKTEFKKNVLIIDNSDINLFEAPYELVKTMRASVYVLGPLLGMYGKAKVSFPGGCAIGPRPVDLHLSGLEKLGAEIRQEHGFIVAETKKLKGSVINFPKVSVGATANILMASVLAEGETVIENAAREPEIVDLAGFLLKMGAVIDGAGTETIRIKGVKKLKGTEYRVIPDRIEAGTFIVLGAMKKNSIKVTNINISHLEYLVKDLKRIGVNITNDKNSVSVKGSGKLTGFDIKTLPFPGFATDLQPIIMVFMSFLPGISAIHETIFENRFTHVGELLRMGADISIIDHVAIIRH
ncbi:MAG: UDP-N-acetylglucosamine 1-carboxyvinyltransferase, partial [Actinomycetia bacterium]|nr:UDP-N-acetylglucosamine 1-carboxyvinyltransferase [Actinomycetes bacterium]